MLELMVTDHRTQWNNPTEQHPHREPINVELELRTDHIAAYWIAFGPHGPRAQDPPGEGTRVFFGTAIAVGVSLALFSFTRLFAKPPPPTMTKEWQEAANEKLIEQRSDPLTGISSDVYTGKGQVQSPPKQN